MEELNRILSAHVADGEDTLDKLLGASFIAVNKDGQLFSGSAGRIDIDPSSKPFATDSFTWIASMTKLITSTCIMQLIEQGKVGLDDDVRELSPELDDMQILPGFDGDEPILENNPKPITLRILLTHTLGLPYDIIDADLTKWSATVNRTDNCLSYTRDGYTTPLKFVPGDSWIYGPATDQAGFVLEYITGDTLGAYMKKHIFDPLGMNDTGHWPDMLPQTHDRTARDVHRVDGKITPAPYASPPDKREIDGGGSGLFSTASDFAKFLEAFLAGRLISKESIRQMFEPQLNDAQRAAMEAIAYDETNWTSAGFAPEFEIGTPISWALGGVINLEDVEGKRRKGSMMWSGMANSRWVSNNPCIKHDIWTDIRKQWIDLETGIAGVLTTRVLPFGDPVVKSLYDGLERQLYKSL